MDAGEEQSRLWSWKESCKKLQRTIFSTLPDENYTHLPFHPHNFRQGYKANWKSSEYSGQSQQANSLPTSNKSTNQNSWQNMYHVASVSASRFWLLQVEKVAWVLPFSHRTKLTSTREMRMPHTLNRKRLYIKQYCSITRKSQQTVRICILKRELLENFKPNLSSFDQIKAARDIIYNKNNFIIRFPAP